MTYSGEQMRGTKQSDQLTASRALGGAASPEMFSRETSPAPRPPLLTTLKPRLSADWSLNATITLFTAMLTTFDGEKNEGLPSNH